MRLSAGREWCLAWPPTVRGDRRWMTTPSQRRDVARSRDTGRGEQWMSAGGSGVPAVPQSPSPLVTVLVRTGRRERGRNADFGLEWQSDRRNEASR